MKILALCLALLVAVPAAAQVFEGPVRPTYTDIGEALLQNRSEFYGWFRGQLADQPIRDAMQQFVTGVVIPDLSYVLEKDCPAVIKWAYAGDGGQMDVIYRRLGNLYENLSSIWSINANGRNYSIDVIALEKFRDCLVGKPAKSYVTQAHRDVLTIHVGPDGRYARWDPKNPSFFRFCDDDATTATPECPPLKSSIAGIGPVNVNQSFPPGTDKSLLLAADQAHAAASGIGISPLSVDAAAQAYEAGPGCKAQPKYALQRACLHFRQMKRFRGFCDPRWGSDNCTRWKHIQHKFFAQWTAAQAKGDWRASRNADSDHQLSHICQNYRNVDLDVRFSVPGVDEHEWPIINCEQALVRLLP